MTLQKFMTDRVFGDRKSDSFSGIGSFKQFVSQMLRNCVITRSLSSQSDFNQNRPYVDSVFIVIECITVLFVAIIIQS